MSMKNKLLLISAIVMISLFSGSVFALVSGDISNIQVEANDVGLSQSSPKSVEKTDELEVLVVFDSNINSTNFQIEAVLRGADLRDPIEELSEVFSVKSGNKYDKRFRLNLPVKMEQGRYDLKIRIDDRTGSGMEYLFPLDIGVTKHSIEIRDVVTSPEEEVGAGKALLVSVRVKNRGESREDDIKIKASIPELGISASAFIDSLDAEGGDDDSATSEELFLRIPNNAVGGDYTLRTVVEFKDGDKAVSKLTKIRIRGEEPEKEDEIVPPSKQEGKTIITVGPESQDIAKGGSVVYALTLTNTAEESRSYTIDVDSANWATFKVSPSNVVVVNKDESKALVVQVTAKDTAPSGEQAFAITVKSSGDTILKQVLLKANVLEGKVEQPTTTSWDNVKRSLEIGLVVLVVLLVILALFIGFSKLKGDEEKPKEEHTYY